MTKLNVTHFLGINKIRKRMHEEGINNPSVEFKKFTRDFIEQLSKMPMEEKMSCKNGSFFDSKGNIIAKLPSK
ncbi:hypothetical protein [uncultured Tenacibaculum sp.]|uniref:hypothetical protein n=1 Tax=uncultured Tenacibaculum sp. TaxID=174713 RepID=UPI00261F8B44|nr:hypothetical protein [uncultured Tenacibaculum sp.]